MKVTVIKEECIGCGLCVTICPEVFRMDDNEKAEVYTDVNDDTKNAAMEAASSCPANAIMIEEFEE